MSSAPGMNQWNGGFGSVPSTSGINQWNGGFGVVPPTMTTALSGTHDIAQRLMKLESLLSGVTADKDKRFIKFGNLNLRSLKECEAWLDSNHPGGDFGFIINFHAAMEHIAQQLGTVGILNHMHSTYRLNIRDLNQAYMVQSFERKLPKFMHASGGHKSLDLKDSHLASLPSWEQWDKPEDGLKAVLEKELSSFCTSFRSTLTDKLAVDYPTMNSIATQALLATENFIITMIAFVEETFKLYSNAHYSPEHAWHITTMLLKSLILKIAEPRVGVALNFEKNDS